MAETNYEQFISSLVKPLVIYADEVVVKTLSVEGNTISLQVMVHPDDLGRVIGKKGRVANSIRTLAFACASKNRKRINISIDSF